MAPKLIGISATPRPQGNSDLLLDELLRVVSDKGIDVEKVRLAEVDLAPCKACNACKKTSPARCAIRDDGDALMDRIRSADGVVFASPIYCFSASAQMKTLLDRMYVLGNRDDMNLLRGKAAGVVLSFGAANSESAGAFNAKGMFEDFFRFFGFFSAGFTLVSAANEGEVSGKPKLLKKAAGLGRKMAEAVL